MTLDELVADLMQMVADGKGSWPVLSYSEDHGSWRESGGVESGDGKVYLY